MASSELRLNGFTFSELFHPDGLVRLDQAFLTHLNHHSPDLHDKLLAYRNRTSTLSAIEISELLISCATVLENFLASLFDIEEAVAISQAKTTSHNPISAFKKYFVLRRAKKELSRVQALPAFAELDAWLSTELARAPLQSDDKELAIALLGTHYLADSETWQPEIEKLVQWCARALTTPEGQQRTSTWTSFRLPVRIDHQQLVHTVMLEDDPLNRVAAPKDQWRHRDGFKLTDPRMDARSVQDEINYCIYCHDHEGDFCSKGFPVKKGDPAQGFKKNPLNVTLTGCPLEEKISEMHQLKKEGLTLAALAMVMVDNPMCPATGHRICNDCMKACIYQKQDPVNIPQIETRVLTDVLDLPWGVEIYDLLTRWNPLRQHQWLMKPYNGLKIMIAGMGPAGFTLAHHLLLEGFAVVGFDGLKIEPLPEALINQPIYRFDDLKESLDERLMAGFGGVAEYGITVRWDKNFLKLIYLSLMRRPHFQVFGGVRFGGTVTVEDAWEMGFDHFVVAVGAGLPKALSVPGSLAPGMRQANDFLMALQLGNAAKSSSLTNLQIRLPAVVIGGGLTGVDTATELQAYYLTQVEKILRRHEILVNKYGEDYVNRPLDAASRAILAEYLRHGLAVRQERERAAAKGEQPNFIKLLHAWGGVTIAYRRSMQESPAYINNHEELVKALQEGVYYAEGLEPASVDLDEFGHAVALICQKRLRKEANEWITTEETVRLPARSILVATGTQPNTAYEFEHRGTFNRLNLQYQHYEDEDGKLTVAHGVEHCKDPQFGPFTSYQKENRRVSLIGDTHPVFHGNVVKAIASGTRTYTKILTLLHNQLGQLGDENEYQQFAERINYLFRARVTEITRKTDNVIELSIQAPLAAKHFKPGQFYRLQNFETYAPHVDHTLFQMEPLALVAAEHHEAQGILNFIVTENSATAKLCAILKKGEPVSLMGPTGVRAKIPAQGETILIIGNQSSFAFLRSYGPSLQAAGNRVIYAGLFNNKEEVYCQKQLERAADVIIWQVRKGECINTHRMRDYSVTGEDMIHTLIAYTEGQLTGQPPAILLTDVDRVFVVGDTYLLRQFQAARKTRLKDYLVKNPPVFASVYGNMQCMLKGVCAQCLQWQIDPETGLRTKAVFACSWQDQPLEIIDIDHIDARQMQNRLLDHLSRLWVEHLFDQYRVAKI
ncbi:FAD-dependent oxidoreductase [Aquicella lusitana]|uniref:Pyridine nucleotide-disulfide oxidoreductase n=1 Tax=Aquicella lusitana TaxID=254246 RepID=A0A370GGD6_9COXI|nr:FAD-dependent oxidoreductase [Aquicella lusitana]RDI42858.1 pyridine nucleotide-disulfide oxidoreductase [Aquicella lusitana]VVC73101.1 Glutamate synthase [NADPH] small chain [Aquicella lusitana]